MLEPQFAFYHASLIAFDGKPLFARGNLPTIHTSLTYAVWYIYWVSRLGRNNTPPIYYVYQLINAERYLVQQGDGLYAVSQIGSIPYDDRNEGVLAEAPPLFHKRWEWAGKATYVPARYLQRVSATTLKQRINPDEWLWLCRNMNSKHPLQGVVPTNAAQEIPSFLKQKNL